MNTKKTLTKSTFVITPKIEEKNAKYIVTFSTTIYSPNPQKGPMHFKKENISPLFFVFASHEYVEKS